MSVSFEVAHLVTHKRRPDSFGHVQSLTPLMVMWLVGGRETKKNHKWGVVDASFEEECSPDDLEITDCPGCGEDTCWCGIGR